MKKKVYSSRELPEPRAVDRTPLLHSVTRFWVTMMVIAGILYVSLLVIGRTAGFRDLVRQQLEIILEIPVSVEGAQVTPGLELWMEGIRHATTNGPPALIIGKASVQFHFPALLRSEDWPFRHVMVSDAVIRFSPGEAGQWTPLPGVAAALSSWMNFEGSSATDTNSGPPMVSEWLRRAKARLEIRNLRLAWMAPEGGENPAAWAEKIDLKTDIVRPFGEDVLWSILRIGQAEAGGEEWLRDLEMEWLRLPDQDIVLRVKGAEPRSGQPAPNDENARISSSNTPPPGEGAATLFLQLGETRLRMAAPWRAPRPTLSWAW